MTKSEVCLFRANIGDRSIELVETFSYVYDTSPNEDDYPHQHRLQFEWLEISDTSGPSDNRPIIIISQP